MSNFHSFTPFYGGIADIKYYWYAAKWQQSLVENIDIVSNPRVFKLPPMLSNNWWSQEVFAYTDGIRYCGSWEIIVDWGIATVWAKSRVNAFSSNDTYYFVDQDWSVAKCPIASATSAASFQSNTTTWLVTLTDSPIRSYPFIRSSSFITTWLYIGSKNIVSLFSFSTETLSQELELPDYINIVWLSEYWQTLNIYTREGIIYYTQKSMIWWIVGYYR